MTYSKNYMQLSTEATLLRHDAIRRLAKRSSFSTLGESVIAPSYEEYQAFIVDQSTSMPCIAATPDGSQLIDYAGTHLPDTTSILDIDPQMTSGFLYFPSPLSGYDRPISALWWIGLPSYDKQGNPLSGTGSIWLVAIPPSDDFALKSEAWRIDRVPIVERANRHDNDANGLNMRRMLAFQLLLTQEVIESDYQRPARQLRRKLERESVVVDPVRIIRLPRRTRKHVTPEHDDVEWSHRWVVNGHWRNQWYPKTETHRPRWIAPYVKGPDDKPLVVKDQRYVFDPKVSSKPEEEHTATTN